MGNSKWKKMGNNDINPEMSKGELMEKRRKRFKQTVQIDRMPVNKPKNHNLPKRDPKGEGLEED